MTNLGVNTGKYGEYSEYGMELSSVCHVPSNIARGNDFDGYN